LELLILSPRFMEHLLFRFHSVKRWWNGRVQRSVHSSGSVSRQG
jgi:hypothetical protein